MSFYTSMYGLSIRLNEQVPGIAVSEVPSGLADIDINFGFMPSWVDQEGVKREKWYVSPEQRVDHDPRLVIWDLLDADHYQICYADGTRFLIDKSGSRIWATWPPETLTLKDTTTYLLGPMMGFILLLRGCISLHASAIAVGDRAIALVGPAGSGKSTTAAAFAGLDYSVLAEDVVTLEDRGNAFMVQPAYPCIRLWPSSVKALYGDEAELPKLTPTWDKCYLDLTQERYSFGKDALPLAAIYLLAERSEAPTSPSIHELPPNEALMSLIANTYATRLMDKTMRAREFELLGRVLQNVPVRRVVPHADPANIASLCQTILADFRSTTVPTLPSRPREHALNV